MDEIADVVGRKISHSELWRQRRIQNLNYLEGFDLML